MEKVIESFHKFHVLILLNYFSSQAADASGSKESLNTYDSGFIHFLLIFFVSISLFFLYIHPMNSLLFFADMSEHELNVIILLSINRLDR